MNIESVKNIFSLFSHELELEKYSPLIALAVNETENMLVSPDVSNDIRLDFLCAAIANYRLQQINASHDRSEITFAGKMNAASRNESPLKYAEKLVCDYINICRDLVKAKTFIFMSFDCGTEDIC